MRSLNEICDIIISYSDESEQWFHIVSMRLFWEFKNLKKVIKSLIMIFIQEHYVYDLILLFIMCMIYK